MLAIIGPIIASLGATVVGQGLQTQLNRIHSPTIPVGSIGRAAQAIRALQERGLTPRIETGPFGNLFLGTEDQPLQTLAAEAAVRQLNQEVLTELLIEDPFLFLRGLPPGDPRRVAVGLDAPAVSQVPPSPGAPGLRIVPTASLQTALRRAVRNGAPSSFALFSQRRSVGRFASR